LQQKANKALKDRKCNAEKYVKFFLTYQTNLLYGCIC